MKSFLVAAVAAFGGIFAVVGTSACPIAWIDEPKMPRSLIEK